MSRTNMKSRNRQEPVTPREIRKYTTTHVSKLRKPFKFGRTAKRAETEQPNRNTRIAVSMLPELDRSTVLARPPPVSNPTTVSPTRTFGKCNDWRTGYIAGNRVYSITMYDSIPKNARLQRGSFTTAAATFFA